MCVCCCHFDSRTACILWTDCWQFEYRIHVFVLKLETKYLRFYTCTTHSIAWNVYLCWHTGIWQSEKCSGCVTYRYITSHGMYVDALHSIYKMATKKRFNLKKEEKYGKKSLIERPKQRRNKPKRNDVENRKEKETKQTTLTRIENKIRFNLELCRSLWSYTMKFCRFFIPMVLFLFHFFSIFQIEILSSGFEWRGNVSRSRKTKCIDVLLIQIKWQPELNLASDFEYMKSYMEMRQIF